MPNEDAMAILERLRQIKEIATDADGFGDRDRLSIKNSLHDCLAVVRRVPSAGGGGGDAS